MSGLKAGAGKQMITPPVGIPFNGHAYPERMAEGINDDLWAKVLVLQQDSLQVAIVAMDLVWPLPENDYVKIRKAVEEATGIEGGNVMVTCTHNHQGPVFAAHPLYNLSIRKQRELVNPYVASIPGRVADAVKQALTDMKEAKVSFAKVPITGLCYNRRKRIPEGVASMTNVDSSLNNFYFGDTPDMARCTKEQYVSWGMDPEEAEEHAPLGLPDGPIDPDLDVVRFVDNDGETIAVLADYATHAVSCSPPVPKLISAGFPGFMTSLVEEDQGGVCLFLYGAGADTRPYRSGAMGFEEAQRVGFVLATGVAQAIRESQPVENPVLKIQSEIVQAALKDYPSRAESEKLLKEKRELRAQAKTDGRYSDAKKLDDEIDALFFPMFFGQWDGEEEWLDKKGEVPLEIQAIAIGDVVILSFPNEVNVSIGMDIKKSAWTKRLMMATLTNGCWMYLVKKEEYDEGGYEAAAARLAPGAGEKLLEAAAKIVERMKEN